MNKQKLIKEFNKLLKKRFFNFNGRIETLSRIEGGKQAGYTIKKTIPATVKDIEDFFEDFIQDYEE